ncbi:hypothetical protein HKBW3S47_02002 [Candidatus Hakubella thermalkaliphila]|uniref:Uncharacterized protein n=1 Tax=Candidatus Hakubella thermalkaliphila TaxID=2754717 RepID=A0A6V8QA68_9ACTN|nr:hypothetical protein HKBW3S47_02002 [Candidatus Hakubella thermalkaliphila]
MIPRMARAQGKHLMMLPMHLNGAELDVADRKIIWKDGSRLTTAQTAKPIHEITGADLLAITNHGIGWLEMGYIPQGLNEKQMEAFEAEIENWITEHEKWKTKAGHST